MAKSSKPVAAAVSPKADGASAYIVTEKAPMRVAGRRVKAGDSITLTDDQARAELLALHIRPEAVEAPASSDA